MKKQAGDTLDDRMIFLICSNHLRTGSPIPPDLVKQLAQWIVDNMPPPGRTAPPELSIFERARIVAMIKAHTGVPVVSACRAVAAIDGREAEAVRKAYERHKNDPKILAEVEHIFLHKQKQNP